MIRINRPFALKNVRIGITLVFFLATGAMRAQDADSQLNSVYQQVLAALPPARQQQVRAAERAWLTFRDKNRVASESAGMKRGQSPEQMRAVTLSETMVRSVQLRQIVISAPPIPVETMRRNFKESDASLNTIYQQCMAGLGSGDQALLRDAQRAWLAYRTASAQAAALSYEGADVAASGQITASRVNQLRAIYLGTHAPGPQPPPVAPLPSETPDPGIPDPFERAR